MDPSESPLDPSTPVIWTLLETLPRTLRSPLSPLLDPSRPPLRSPHPADAAGAGAPGAGAARGFPDRPGPHPRHEDGVLRRLPRLVSGALGAKTPFLGGQNRLWGPKSTLLGEKLHLWGPNPTSRGQTLCFGYKSTSRGPNPTARGQNSISWDQPPPLGAKRHLLVAQTNTWWPTPISRGQISPLGAKPHVFGVKYHSFGAKRPSSVAVGSCWWVPC